MNNRISLHNALVEILGSRNVYFQPPESIKISYPAIVYERSDIRNNSADDDVYFQTHHYRITIIDKNPDSAIVSKMSKFYKARFERHFVSEGLNHDVFTIYY